MQFLANSDICMLLIVIYWFSYPDKNHPGGDYPTGALKRNRHKRCQAQKGLRIPRNDPSALPEAERFLRWE